MLKPLCGDEPGLYDCLRSFCDQDYPDLQIVFGVQAPDDPAIAVVRRLIADFPDRMITLVVDPRSHGANPKVSNLINMMSACRHDIVVISDSDVDVDRHALSSLVAPLADPQVGAVSCLYKGQPIDGMAARMAAQYINDWFLPSAIVDEALHGVDGLFGPLIAVRRTALDGIGGFESLSDYLAEDNRLGRLLRESGWIIRLSRTTVHTMVSEKTFSSLFQHEVRWGRTVRACRPRDHVLSVITFPLPLLLGLLAIKPTLIGTVLVALHTVLRITLHFVIRSCLSLRTRSSPLTVPLREILCFAVWAASLHSNLIHWRHRTYRVMADGRIREISPDP